MNLEFAAFIRSGIYSLSLIGITLTVLSCDQRPNAPNKSPIKTEVHSGQTLDYSNTRNAYFGDLHVHSSWSFDAFIYNVRNSPDDAYKYGKGEPVGHVSGKTIQMNRPLDFMAVSDHSEYMGVMIQMSDKSNPLSHLEIAKKINDPDPGTSRRAFGEIGQGIATNTPNEELIQDADLRSTWERMVAIADRHNVPGKFTTFPAYEWTSSPAVYDADPQYARNLHRNVIFKGGKVAAKPFSSFDSQRPEDLWKWMEEQRTQDIEVIAIPHNANISDGTMYALTNSDGEVLDAAYAQTRMRNEPINEVVQIKGQSMAHPALSPNDEFSNFEIYMHTLGRGDPRVQSQPDGGFVRDAFKNGLAIAQSTGSNPFQFGVIGSSDGHNGATNVEEDNNIGKSGVQDPNPQRRMADGPASIRHRQSSVAGLAGVWAEENTRKAIFEAFERKEVFATSGPRIKVRFFGGWNIGSVQMQQENWLDQAYQSGVPMGGSLESVPQNTGVPTFLIWAVKDGDGANLDRIQVIKGWVDTKGDTHEKIYDVAWAGDRTIGPNGILPPVGNTVDISGASYTNDIGAVSLQTVWVDTDFDRELSAFYYLRVLEIPTPRWTTYDAATVGVPLPDEVPPTIQERAWSSPIWYEASRQ